jgi:hypothetical protein
MFAHTAMAERAESFKKKEKKRKKETSKVKKK